MIIWFRYSLLHNVMMSHLCIWKKSNVLWFIHLWKGKLCLRCHFRKVPFNLEVRKFNSKFIWFYFCSLCSLWENMGCICILSSFKERLMLLSEWAKFFVSLKYMRETYKGTCKGSQKKATCLNNAECCCISIKIWHCGKQKNYPWFG